MTDIVIRETNASDTPVILGLVRELAIYEKLEHEVTADNATLQESLFGNQPRAYALLAEIDKKPIGLCLYFYNFSTFLGRPGIYIEDIYIKPEHRKKGLGKKFFAKLGEVAKANNCGRIEWWVLDWNQSAIDFYKRLGAEAMSEWTVYRLTQDKFDNLKK